MPARLRKKVTVSILIPFLVFVFFFSVMIWQKYRSSHEVPVTSAQRDAEGSRPVTLFFAEEGTRLAREARVITPCDDDNACLKSVLDELLNGPVGEFDETVPEGTVVTGVSVDGTQATIEFNRTFSEGMLSGSAAEMLAVYSIVDTVAANFPHILKVKLNIDGDTKAVLRHLDLSDPLLPDYSLEQSRAPQPEAGSSELPTKSKGAPR